MNIVVDTNIPYGGEAFAHLGTVRTLPGRSVSSELLGDVSALIVRSVTKVNAELLEGTPVRFVGTATIGTDHVDTGYLARQGIGFASAPGSNADSVAEYVVAALLRQAASTGRPLQDMTLGIIGVGNVGSRVRWRAEALGMKCLLNDPPLQRATKGEEFISRETLLASADVVTVHVPLSTQGPDATWHMVNAEFLKTMKDGAQFINTSRGSVVDEPALLASRDRLGGLVLDVWENEPAIDPDMLAAAQIATPHIAGYSFDGKVRGTDMISRAASEFFGIDRDWSGERYLAEEGATVVLAQSRDPLGDAVGRAYPIMEDDRRLRETLGMDASQAAIRFDLLRKEYPRRLEFRHFTVEGCPSGHPACQTLAHLGFSLR
jgi:erythronate-4-phosphate dehydrogenase